MTAQIPDSVLLDGVDMAITAVDGDGLFDPAARGWPVGALGTACWRGYICGYAVPEDLLLLDTLEIGFPADRLVFGKRGRRSDFGGTRYADLGVPIGFTGRVLLGARAVSGIYLNMGYWPAWLYEQVIELEFDGGQLIDRQDRSEELAEVRQRLGPEGAKPAAGESTADWVSRTFSLTYEYSWPQ